MITFDLACLHGHRFEGWFRSSEDFARQQERGLLCCPECGESDVTKAPMAPAVPRKGNQQRAVAVPEPSQEAVSGDGELQPVSNSPMPPEMAQALQKLANMQAEALKTSEWVGDKFAEKSRAMHYGEQDAKPIHGQASPGEARELLEEGIAVAPLIVPVAPPDEVN